MPKYSVSGFMTFVLYTLRKTLQYNKPTNKCVILYWFKAFCQWKHFFSLSILKSVKHTTVHTLGTQHNNNGPLSAESGLNLRVHRI